MSQWVEDPNEPSGWRWDHKAPPGDPTVTQIFNAILYPPTHTPSPNSSDVDPALMPPEDQHQHGGDE